MAASCQTWDNERDLGVLLIIAYMQVSLIGGTSEEWVRRSKIKENVSLYVV